MLICKQFKLDAAHTVAGSYTCKCDRTNGGGIHGHTYKINVILDSLKLDETGMVMDFTKVKHLVNDFIDSFDHSLMINANDHLMVELGRILSDRYVLLPYNPTAELMAVHFFAYIYSIPELAPFIHSVQVYETETSWAQCDHADYGQMSDLISFGKERFSKAVATGWNDETRARLVVDHYEVLEKRTITVLNGRNLGVALDSPSVQ